MRYELASGSVWTGFMEVTKSFYSPLYVLFSETPPSITSLSRELTRSGHSAEGVGSALVVSVLYVARHAYLYYGLARWLVQWEKSLF